MSAFWSLLLSAITGSKGQAVLLSAGSVAFASGVILGNPWKRLAWIAVLASVVLSLLIGEVLAGWLLRKPDNKAAKPKVIAATRAVNLYWVGLVAIGVTLAGLVLVLLSKLPDNAASETELTVVAVVGGLATVEALKALAIDADAIESVIQWRWRARIGKLFDELLEVGRIHEKQLRRDDPPSERSDEPIRTSAYIAAKIPAVYGGWGREARTKRAHDIESAIDKDPDSGTG